ncbi:MAG: radical SAM protein [Candidatus Nezhaarchaeota archaeon]|nr:radical SAM protein [Candidatus Nezhaarchaeota archaeon]
MERGARNAFSPLRFKANELRFKVVVDKDECRQCGACGYITYCPSPVECVGCLSCLHGCPFEARRLVEVEDGRGAVKIWIGGEAYEVPGGVTIRQGLELLGFKVGAVPGEGVIQAPCGVGGCYTCVVYVDGEPRRACVTPVRDGMKIEFREVPERELRRVVHGPQPHTVGGKATPWGLKTKGRYVEVAVWAAGCNLRCPQCQNWEVTYDGRSEPLTPRQVAEELTVARRRYGVDRMAISGGEPTVNRRWLVSFFKNLKELNLDPGARLHLDSNGTLLTPSYIDELVEVGVTDIGVEPKAVSLDTYMKITGLRERELASRFLDTAWRAVEYIANEYYPEQVFLGVGLPYNSQLMPFEEALKFAEKLCSIDPSIQLCVLDYFPAFRRRQLKRPSPFEMLRLKRALEEVGLKCVVVQTSIGHFGPPS